MNKKIFIADILSHTREGKSTGHYFAVARNYLEIFSANVIVAGGPVYRTGFKDSDLLELPYNAGGGGIRARLKTFVNACKLFKEAQGNIIVLQQCTTITTFLCIALFYVCKSKLYLIQYSREGFRSSLGRLFFKLAKQKIDGIICPNDMVGKAFEGIPYCVVPDYIYTEENRKKNKPFDKRAYDICMVGRIAPEKGIIEAARVLAKSDYKVIIAGKPQTNNLGEELEKICSDAENIDLRLGYIDEEEYYGYLQNSKFAILNYLGEYSERSSGVIFDTLFNGVPVIAKNCKALQFIDEYELGYIYDSLENINFSKVIQESFYTNTVKHIFKYCEQQKTYIYKLKNFLYE